MTQLHSDFVFEHLLPADHLKINCNSTPQLPPDLKWPIFIQAYYQVPWTYHEIFPLIWSTLRDIHKFVSHHYHRFPLLHCTSAVISPKRTHPSCIVTLPPTLSWFHFSSLNMSTIKLSFQVSRVYLLRFYLFMPPPKSSKLEIALPKTSHSTPHPWTPPPPS